MASNMVYTAVGSFNLNAWAFGFSEKFGAPCLKYAETYLKITKENKQVIVP